MGTVLTTTTAIGANNESDELELQVVRYKPEGLEQICRRTHFTRKELQALYRGFKQQCPTGIVNEDTFKEIYANFFPQGDSSSYAHFVFNTFDHEHSGIVNFEEFIEGLSVLARGTLTEKLQWAFNLYDTNNDGVITKEEMLNVISSIYDLMGRYTDPIVDEHTAKEHVDRIFEIMDKNQDGVISEDEFYETCQQDENMLASIVMFDTVL